MEIFLGWLLFSILPALAAKARGRSGVAWFFLSLVISPLFALIAVLVMRPIESEKPWTAGAPAPSSAPATSYRREPAAPAQKKCPDCAEMVLAEARICRHCRHEFKAPPKQLQREIVGFGLAKSAAPVFPGVKVCPACYETNTPEWKICKRCGGKLPETQASGEVLRGCRVCAESIPGTARVCRHCGANQDSPAA